jgi:hypothetical protein
MTDPMLEKLVRFQHPDRTLGYTRSLTDSTRAALSLATQKAIAARTLASIHIRRQINQPSFT